MDFFERIISHVSIYGKDQKQPIDNLPKFAKFERKYVCDLQVTVWLAVLSSFAKQKQNANQPLHLFGNWLR